jgi:hypothetical protein
LTRSRRSVATGERKYSPEWFARNHCGDRQKWIVPFVINLQMPSWHHWIEIETDRLNDNRALASGGSNTRGRTGSDTANGVHAGHRDGKRRIEYPTIPIESGFQKPSTIQIDTAGEPLGVRRGADHREYVSDRVCLGHSSLAFDPGYLPE